MAKKPKEEVVVVKDENRLSGISESLIEKYGNIICDGEFLKINLGNTIPTGLLSFDIAFNGGIREGSILHLGGAPKSGKTTFCLTLAKEMKKAGKNVYYVDAEARLQPELIECVEGLSLKDVNIIKSSPEKPLSAEDFLTIIETIIKDDPGCFIVLDSIAALSPEVELSSEMGEQQRAATPKILYKFLRKIIQFIGSTKSILVTITHTQKNVTGYGAPTVDVGGEGIKFFASYWMSCISSTNIEEGDKKVGKDSKFKMMAVANGPPDAEPTLFVRYGRGADKYLDLFNIAQDCGLVLKGGAWYTIQADSAKDDEVYPKIQGEKKACQYLKDNPAVFEELDKKIRDLYFGEPAK